MKEESETIVSVKFSHLPKRIPRNNKLLLFVILGMTISFPVAYGYDAMMMSALNSVVYYKDYFHITPATSNLNTASLWIGELLSTPFIELVADRYGRRWSVITGLAFIYIGIILQSAAQNTASFVIARILLGFGFNIGAVAIPTLVSELCPPQHRGFVLGAFFSCFLLGSIISSSVTYGSKDIKSTWSWRLPSIIQGAPCLLSTIFVWWSPESPRFLISKGHEAEAREILAIVNQASPEDEAVEEVVQKMNSERTEPKATLWAEIFKGKSNQRRLFINFIQAALAEMGGSSVCSYYQSFLLDQAGITLENQKLQVSIVSSCWCWVWALAGSKGFDLFGRKTLGFYGSIGMSVSFFIMGGLIKARNDNPSISAYGPVAMIFVFQLFYSFSFSALNFAYTPECWPNRTRVVGVSWYTIWSNCIGLIANFCLPIAMENMGYKFYFLNAGYNIIFTILLWWFWVETKGVNLEDIDDLFDQAPYGVMGNKWFVPPTKELSDTEMEVIEIEVKAKS